MTRYQPSTPCMSHVPRFFGGSWNTTLHPGGAIGVLLLSNTPLSISYADSLGFMRDGCMRFSVVTDKDIRQHQRCIRNDGCTVASPDMKWSLETPIAFSAAFVRFRLDGTSYS